MGARSVPSLGSRWVDSNRFSILANLGREEGPWFEEDVGVGFSESQTKVYDDDTPHTGKELVDGLLGGSKLLLLPREVERILVFLVVGCMSVALWSVFRCLGGIRRQQRIRC